MSKMKRGLSLLLALIMVLGLVPATAFAAPAPGHKCPSERFKDVSENAWYHESVDYVLDHGLMYGIFYDTFGPESSLSRGMVVTILHRLEGEPTVQKTGHFLDVKESDWFYEGVEWAAANGIVYGIGGNRYAPNNPLTREQMATILYRYEDYKGHDTTGRRDLSGFSDASKISEYAREPLSWAFYQGYINGMNNDLMDPKGYTTRAQIAAIMMNLGTKGPGNEEPEKVDPGMEDPGPLEQPDTYVLVFDLNYDGAPKSETLAVAEGQLPSRPADPVREGYTFEGWYTQAEGGQLVDFKKPMAGDTTVYAHWKRADTSKSDSSSSRSSGSTSLVCSVTFDLNYAGAPAGETVRVKVGGFVTPPANPVRTGYTFTGWYTSASGGYVFDTLKAITGNTTVYAHWVKNGTDVPETISLVFELNYDGAPIPEKVRADKGKSVKAPADPVREGYTFAGWYTKAEGGKAVDFSKGFTRDTTVYAHWTKNQSAEEISVVFELNYRGAPIPKKVTAEKGKAVKAPADPVREGFAFAGWYTKAEGGKTADLSKGFTRDTTVYAHWTKNEPDPAELFTVTFELNYDGAPAPEKVAVEKGQAVKMPADPERDGYAFGGWFLQADGVAMYDFAEPVTGDVTLYAFWWELPPILGEDCLVRFELNYNGAPEAQVEMVSRGDTVPRPKDPAREGYFFLGWFTAPDGGEPYDFSQPVNEGMALFAQWEEIAPLPETVTVTFDLNYEGAPEADVMVAEKGDTMTEPEEPARSGYAFLGWYAQATGGSKYDFSQPMNEDMKLFAQWSKKEDAKIIIGVKWLDLNGDEITGEAPEAVSFTNGYQLGESTVTADKQVSFVENPLMEYDCFDITLNGEKVSKINFTADAGTTYNIVFTNQAVEANRRPNDKPINLGKLYQLISDGYIDATLYDDATIRAIDGQFSTIPVNNEKDAVKVLDQISPLLGLDSDTDNFSADDITVSTTGEGDTQRSYYRLNPTVNGVPVYGSDMVLVVDTNGMPDGLNSSYDSRINSVNTTPDITAEEAEQAALDSFRSRIVESIMEEDSSNLSVKDINEFADFITSSVTVDSILMVYAINDEESPNLTWRVTIYTQAVSNSEEGLIKEDGISETSIVLPLIDESYYVYANGERIGEVLQIISNKEEWTHATDTARDANNNLRTFNIENSWNISRLSDSKRNIKTYITSYVPVSISPSPLLLPIVKPVLPGTIIIKNPFGWNEKGVSAHYNLSKAYDFYNRLGRKSYDGKNANIIASVEYVPSRFGKVWLLEVLFNCDACWSRSNKQFMFYHMGNFESALDVVGHEYTHAVINTIVGGSSLETTLTYKGETGGLNESYADIMGSLIEGKDREDNDRWLLSEDGDITLRNISNPASMKQPDHYSALTGKEGVHVSSGVFNYAYYKMVMDNDASCRNSNHKHTSRTSSVSDKTWAKVFYNSIHHLTVSAKFVDARWAVIVEARANGFTDEQIQAIKEAFEDVGITGNDVYLAEDTFDWTWYEHQDYTFKHMWPQPENRAHSISISGKDIVMNGFNEEAYKDFLFMPNSDTNEKLFSFDLVRDRTDWHSIEGAGFLFNTKIENNTIEGYCILTTESGLKLVRIDSCDLDAFRNGEYWDVEDAGSLLTTVDIGDPYAKQSYSILVSPSEISVWCNDNKVIDQYQLSTTSTSYGFGPITSHGDHCCSQLSYYTFSNIRMESLQ